MNEIDIYGLIGYPLSHSLSASIFNTWFKENGHQAHYELFPIEEITDVRIWAEGIPRLRGFNVTIPYKRHLIDFLDECTPAATEIGAINTVWVDRQESGLRLCGNNTDWVGFKESLLELGIPDQSRALILGGGGAARAAAYALKELGISYRFVSRSQQESHQLAYNDITDDIIASHRLVVNAAPWGMFPDIATYPPLPYKSLTTNHLVYDMVYNPAITKFMKYAEEAGARTTNGHRMLILQAQRSWEWWQAQIQNIRP